MCPDMQLSYMSGPFCNFPISKVNQKTFQFYLDIRGVFVLTFWFPESTLFLLRSVTLHNLIITILKFNTYVFSFYEINIDCSFPHLSIIYKTKILFFIYINFNILNDSTDRFCQYNQKKLRFQRQKETLYRLTCNVYEFDSRTNLKIY